MKKLILSLFLLISSFCFSQKKAESGLPANSTVVASLQKPKMVIYKNPANQFFIAKKKGKEWISWDFKSATSYPADTFEIMEKQIDKKRKPEIVISWNHLVVAGNESEMMAKRFECDLTEIWNLDNQTCIFSTMTNRDEFDVVNDKTTHCHYNYSILISANGDIVLNHLQKEAENCPSNKPDNEMGTYYFDGTRYVRRK